MKKSASDSVSTGCDSQGEILPIPALNMADRGGGDMGKQPPGGDTGIDWESVRLRALLYPWLVGFIAAPFLIVFWKSGLFQTPTPGAASEADLSQQMFAVFALLPGLIGLGNYAVNQRLQRGFRHRSNTDLAAKCSAAPSEKPEEGQLQLPADADAEKTAEQAAEDSIAQCRTTLGQTFVASAMLTGVFLVLAIVSWYPHTAANSGLIYSGYGAYISTLWYLLARLNASALSPRFLVNSAVKASIAMFIGCAIGHGLFAGAIGIGSAEMPTKMFCFLIGLFHPLAMKSLKKTAIKTFGGQVVADADFPVLIIEGINDEVADLLEELGIASTQHLATANVPELAERSLYPQERILDWVDQAILAVHTGGELRELRSAGIHSATELLALAAYGRAPCDKMAQAASKRLNDAGERAGFFPDAMLLLVECIKNDPGLAVFRNARQYDARLRNVFCRAEPDANIGKAPLWF